MKEMTIVFYGIDDWNRPCFREVIKKENGDVIGGKNFFGDTDNLFSYGAKKEVIDFYADVDVNKHLLYFGSYFGCEPLGYAPYELKEPVKLIFDVELTKKLHNIEG